MYTDVKPTNQHQLSLTSKSGKVRSSNRSFSLMLYDSCTIVDIAMGNKTNSESNLEIKSNHCRWFILYPQISNSTCAPWSSASTEEVLFCQIKLLSIISSY